MTTDDSVGPPGSTAPSRPTTPDLVDTDTDTGDADPGTVGPSDPGSEAAVLGRIRRWSRAVTAASTALYTLLLTSGRPWNLFADAGFSSDFYDAQARAMWRLRFDVPASVAGPEGFDIGGRIYVYFGPMLSIVRMPFVLLGDWIDGRLTRLSMIVGFVVLCLVVERLALEARRLATDGRPDRSTAHDHHRVALLVAATATSPAMYLAGWPSVYHETELWGAALLVLTVVYSLRWHRTPTRRAGALAVAAAAATVLTRATMGFGAIAVVGLVALLLLVRARRQAIEVIGGLALALGVHLAINVAKLGSLIEMPWQRQVLTLQSPVRSQWLAANGDSFFSPSFVPTTALQYLRPDTVAFERLVPFVRFGPLGRQVGDARLETITPSGSLTATATVLFALFVVGTVEIVRRRRWPWAAGLVGSLIAAVPSFMIGFIAGRYLVDMLPMLIVPAAIAAFSLQMPPATVARRAVGTGLVALVVWGAWVNGALAAWTVGLKQPGFTEWRYRLDDVVFGDPAPALIDLVPGAPLPRDGVVGLLRDPAAGTCDGVYVAEQNLWVALERTNGATSVTGTLALADVDGPTPVAGGDTWTVTVAPTDDGRFRFSLDAGDQQLTGDPVTIEPDDRVTVVADQLGRELSVRVGGEVALFSFVVPDGRPLPYAALTPDADPGDSLCRQLEARR